ncbi:superoxide dismutase family protein [Ulvibacter litoralis]|uniref:Superoxide dismutase [Cu-Zn] n=1 Tax=Ulvibacter litoralis TaxID=227084 RepID=A0A1G7F1G5_9FLAO|nr:superoxide dismutase family protein [Ulvibacter litoralis]GHC53179.1 superoxide dismutase [Cu-Zn] [Ulvibacter litoralis]SDE69455.1 superoxide dismutase, Cu-Zn family [Ulvibacter litoralis]
MKKIGLSIAVIALVALSSCKGKKADAEMDKETTQEMMKEDVKVEKTEAKIVSFALESKSGSTASGKGEFREVDGVVKFEVKLSGLTPGTHAIHIHEKADCSSPDGKSTGGHWNPTHEQHGKWGSSQGYHKGDIGNFNADENGEGSISMQTDEWCIGCGDEKKDVLGKAIIVHQGVDDFVTQPTGDAGGRVSCGGIIQ